MADLRSLIATLIASYPSANIEAANVTAYESALADLPLDELEAVIVEHIRTSRYFPAISELVGRVVERRLALPDPSAAWLLVERAAVAGSGYRELPAPLREAAETVGGPYSIRTSENPIATRAHFIRAYEARRREAVEREALPPGRRPELGPAAA